jgi:superoxide reductase
MSQVADYIRTDDFKNEKHVPVIELPDGIKANEPFNVTVSVGKEVPHPNTTEHFIQWISLLYKPEDEQFVYDLGKAEFVAHGASTKGANEGPAYTNPVAVFNVKLAKPGKLTAIEYCNIHGLWENTVDVKL